MKFEPAHDPDPIRSRFSNVSTILDMSEFHKGLWGECARKVVDQVNSILDCAPEEIPEVDLSILDKRDAKDLVAGMLMFMSYQEMQMDTMQLQLEHLHRAFYELSRKLNKNQSEQN